MCVCWRERRREVENLRENRSLSSSERERRERSEGMRAESGNLRSGRTSGMGRQMTSTFCGRIPQVAESRTRDYSLNSKLT